MKDWCKPGSIYFSQPLHINKNSLLSILCSPSACGGGGQSHSLFWELPPNQLNRQLPRGRLHPPHPTLSPNPQHKPSPPKRHLLPSRESLGLEGRTEYISYSLSSLSHHWQKWPFQVQRKILYDCPPGAPVSQLHLCPSLFIRKDSGTGNQ